MMSGGENGIFMHVDQHSSRGNDVEYVINVEECRRILDLIFETVKDMFKLIYLK